MNILIWVYTVVFAINFALRVCARMYSIPVCIGINTRIMIRAYIVFYSALIFVCNAYSYDTRIHTIRVFVRYAHSYDTRIRLIRVSYAYRMLRYTRAILYFLLLEIFLIFAWKMSTVRTNSMVTFSAQNAGNGIPGLQISKISREGMPPDPSSHSRSLNMLRSDIWLDPPLQ